MRFFSSPESQARPGAVDQLETQIPVFQTLAFAGLLSYALLLPFARLSELGVLLTLIAAGLAAIRDWPGLRSRLRAGFALPAFALVLLAALQSCVDAVQVKESLMGSLGLLRFLGLIVAAALLSASQREQLGRWMFWILLLWAADALVQAATGYGLRGASAPDRITGIFGQDNPKLGLVLAALSPIALYFAPSARLKRALVWAILALAILLAGARAGWLMFMLASLAWLLHLVGKRWSVFAKLVSVGMIFFALSAITLNAINEKFAGRVSRTAQALQTDGLDFALAGRLPIWRTALNMSADNPINGVGVRSFRYAYPSYAQANDPWVRLSDQGEQGATHPHQLFLEIASETGLIGLVCWVAAFVFTVRAWRANNARRDAKANVSAWPFACALCVFLFPFNTHTAMYSSFWAGVLWFIVALTSAAWQSDSNMSETHAS
jgi:O-antigen ligase